MIGAIQGTSARRLGCPSVPTVLLATDADRVLDEVEAALSDEQTRVLRVRSGEAVAPAVREHSPDLVVLDLQIGNMGGIAACLDLRHEEGMGRLPAVPVLMLLDRSADAHLARRSAADGWLIKPLDALRIAGLPRRSSRAGSYAEEPDVPTVPAET